jgi:hypothetical protein
VSVSQFSLERFWADISFIAMSIKKYAAGHRTLKQIRKETNSTFPTLSFEGEAWARKNDKVREIKRA